MFSRVLHPQNINMRVANRVVPDGPQSKNTFRDMARFNQASHGNGRGGYNSTHDGLRMSVRVPFAVSSPSHTKTSRGVDISTNNIQARREAQSQLEFDRTRITNEPFGR